jgi:hypothetical protein
MLLIAPAESECQEQLEAEEKAFDAARMAFGRGQSCFFTAAQVPTAYERTKQHAMGSNKHNTHVLEYTNTLLPNYLHLNNSASFVERERHY